MLGNTQQERTFEKRYRSPWLIGKFAAERRYVYFGGARELLNETVRAFQFKNEETLLACEVLPSPQGQSEEHLPRRP